MFRLYRDDRHREIDIGIIRGDLVIPPATQGIVAKQLGGHFCFAEKPSPIFCRKFYNLSDIISISFSLQNDPQWIPGIVQFTCKFVYIVYKVFPNIRKGEL